MSVGLTEFESLLKEHFTDDKLKNLGLGADPVLAWLAKSPNANGKYTRVPVVYGNGSNLGSDDTMVFDPTDTTTQDGSSSVDFQVSRAKNYSKKDLDRDTYFASEDDGALDSLFDVELEGMLKRVAHDISRQIFGDGTGNVAQLTSGSGTTTTIQLEAGGSIAFEKGDRICLRSTPTGSLRDSGNSATVLAVNRSLDQLTFADLGTSISGATGGDYVVRRKTNLSGTMIQGFGAWIPQTAPDSTSFLSVDRSVDVNPDNSI